MPSKPWDVVAVQSTKIFKRLVSLPRSVVRFDLHECKDQSQRNIVRGRARKTTLGPASCLIKSRGLLLTRKQQTGDKEVHIGIPVDLPTEARTQRTHIGFQPRQADPRPILVPSAKLTQE